MKRYIKLFEEFISEEDPLADLMGGDDKEKKEPKEDPLEKAKKEKLAKEKKAEKKHDKYVEKKGDKIDDILKKIPEIDEKIGDKIRDAVESQDRVKIHNAALDVTYLQQDYAEKGDTAMINRLSPLKDYIDDLDRSFTNDKMM
jgi:hypothetical protein